MSFEGLPLLPVFVIVAACLLVATLFASLYASRQNKRHNYALNRLQREKQALAKTKYTSEESNIPNIDFIQRKMAMFESSRGQVHYLAHVICVGKNGDFYRFFDSQTATGIKQRLHDLLSQSLKPSLIGLYDDRYIVMLFASDSAIKSKSLIEHQQKVRATLPNEVEVDQKDVPFEYSVTSLNFASDSEIARPDRLFRRISYGILRSIQNESGLYIHSEKEYQEHLHKRHMLQALQRDIRLGIKQFGLEYQSIFHSMNSEKEYLREVSLRWKNSKFTRHGNYLTLLSDNPHVQYSLTLMVVNWVVKLLSTNSKGMPCISINIQASDLGMASFYRDIKNIAETLPSVCSKLVFEVSNYHQIPEQKHAKDNITQLKKLGCRFAIDNFGSGHLNQELLSDGWFDIIKLDETIAQQMRTKTGAHETLRFVLRLTERLNIDLVVNGIVQELQQKHVPKKGHIFLQGDLLGKKKIVAHG